MRFGALVEHYKWSIKFLQENLFVWLVVGEMNGLPTTNEYGSGEVGKPRQRCGRSDVF